MPSKEACVATQDYMTIDLQGLDGYETFAIDSHTVGIRPKWISVEEKEPPKDGTPFLCFDPQQAKNFVHGCIYVVRFEEETNHSKAGYVECGGECYFKWTPTHWMPLPKPPRII